MPESAIDKSFKKYADRISADAEERTQHYFKALETRFSEKLDGVKTELIGLTEVVEETNRKLDIVFDKVGEIAVDVEIIKNTVKDHEIRIQRAEAKAS